MAFPQTGTSLQKALAMESGGAENSEASVPAYDSCINCNSVLLQECSKISKIFRLASAYSLVEPITLDNKQSDNNDNNSCTTKTKTEVSLGAAISVVFNTHNTEGHVEDSNDSVFVNRFVCEKCGKLLELAYNAIMDFTELSKRGSTLQKKMIFKIQRTENVLASSQPVIRSYVRNKLTSGDRNTPRESKRSQRLMNDAKKACNRVTKKVENGSERSNKKVRLEDTKTINCSMCDQSFVSEALLKKHKRLFHISESHHSESQDKDTNELRCSKKPFPKGKLESDKDSNTEKISIKTEHCSNVDVDNIHFYYCTICDLEFETKDSFQCHSNHDEDLEEIENEIDVSNNLEDEQGPGCDLLSDKLKCKLCGEGNRTIAELKEHYRKHHPLVSILTVNDMHSNSGENKKKEFNDVNDDELVRGKGVSRKMPGNSERLIFNCNVCNKQFIRHDHIKLHLRTHTGEKPFVCKVEDCRKTFSDPRGLAYHEITHSNERPYCCKFCGMTFKRLHHLNDHERNHNDVPRRFICNFCEKGFKHRKHLNSHLVIHRGTKEHQCNRCFKAFNRKDNLQQHIKKVHAKDSDSTSVGNELKSASSSPHKNKNEKSVLKLMGGETGVPTSMQTIVFHTPCGTTVSNGAIDVATNSSRSISSTCPSNNEINQASKSTTTPLPSTSTPSIVMAAGGKVSTAAATIPLAIAITDPAAIDQIVYMHL